MQMQDDKLHEECGVFGVWSMKDIDAAQWIYYGQLLEFA